MMMMNDGGLFLRNCLILQEGICCLESVNTNMDELILTGRLNFEDKNYCDNEAVLGAPRVHVTWPQLISIMVSAYRWSRQNVLWCKQGGGNQNGYKTLGLI